MGKLDGKVALITGASQGIGKGIALAFASAGSNVVATARTMFAIDAVVEEVRDGGSDGLAITADIGLKEDRRRIVESAIEAFGRVDILVNNAAIIHPQVDLVDFEPSLWREVINVNLIAVAMITQDVLKGMIDQKFGKIINIASIGGRKGARGRTAYRATKAALVSLTESVAAEVKEHGIDVNCICPGGVDTKGYREAFGNRGREDNPRLMVPQDIADVAVFLASDDSSAITGSAIDAFGETNPLFA